MTSSLFTESSDPHYCRTPLRSTLSSHDTLAYMTMAKRREHEHRHPDQRDVVGLAGIEDRAAEAVLGGDELADDRAGQGASPMFTRSTEMIQGRQNGTTSLRNTCIRVAPSE